MADTGMLSGRIEVWSRSFWAVITAF